MFNVENNNNNNNNNNDNNNNNNNRTNQIKAKIDRTQEDCLCRMCKQADETVNHLLSECSKMAQREFKRRHDWLSLGSLPEIWI